MNLVSSDVRTFEGLSQSLHLLKQYAADELASGGHTLEAAQACVLVCQETSELEEAVNQLREMFREKSFHGVRLEVPDESGD